MIYPERLNKGDLIGLTATSSAVNLEKVDKAINNIKKLGYNIVETKSVRNNNVKCVSNDYIQRANEFIDLWNDDNVKMIIEARGGEFLMETIPFIDEKFTKEKLYLKSKWVRGYSDITGLLFYLTTKYDIATVECDNFSNYAMSPLHDSLLKSFDAVSERNEIVQHNYDLWQKYEDKDDKTYKYNLTQKNNCNALKNKKEINMSGRLIGGCLDVLSIYRGTKYDYVSEFIERYKNDGIIWHLENCGYNAADVYRILWEMKIQGWFKYASGFLIGRTHSGQSVEDFTYLDALEKGIGDLGVRSYI